METVKQQVIKQVIDEETAKIEFDRFTESMDLDLDKSNMDAEDLTAFEKNKNRILTAIQRGAMIINEDGEAVYTPQHKRSKYKESITFHERTGASLMAMDSKKKNHDVAKTYAVMADMCSVHPGIFAGLVGTDVKVCEAIFSLLMD